MYRIVTDKIGKPMALSLAFMAAVVVVSPCMAADKASQPSDGFMMFTINTACGKQNPAKLAPNSVEQLQAVHKLSQTKSPETFQGLIDVLQSSSPLARRKAAKALLDEWPIVSQASKSQRLAGTWVEQLKPFMKDTDWVVQKTVVRLLTIMNSGASKAAVQSFTISMTPEDRTFFETGLTAVKPTTITASPKAPVEPDVVAVDTTLPVPPVPELVDGLQKASLPESVSTH